MQMGRITLKVLAPPLYEADRHRACGGIPLKPLDKPQSRNIEASFVSNMLSSSTSLRPRSMQTQIEVIQ